MEVSMIIQVSNVLTPEQVQTIRRQLDQAPWVDGALTAGSQAVSVKHNQQLAPHNPLAQQLGDTVLSALAQHPVFISAALPLKIYPPMFNRYQGGETYGWHVDNALRVVPGTAVRVRTDLSATLFLSEPDDYEGGDLCIQDKFGTQRVKLNAGDMILYPSTSVHCVEPVTQGVRTCAFFWLQSMVRNHEHRDQLFDLDQSIQSLSRELSSQHKDVVQLTGLYQRLIQQWAET